MQAPPRDPDDDVLDLSRAGLVTVDQARPLSPNLRVLYLCQNQIRELPSLDALPMLEVLDVSCNLLELVPASCLAGNANLRTLNCGHNRLRKVPWIAQCHQLRSVQLDANDIVSLSNVPAALPASIMQLDVANNLVASLQELRFLVQLSQLRQLDLRGNPVAAIGVRRGFPFRPYLAFLLPSLNIADGDAVDAAARDMASRLFLQDREGGMHPGLSAEKLELLRPPHSDEELVQYLIQFASPPETSRQSPTGPWVATDAMDTRKVTDVSRSPEVAWTTPPEPTAAQEARNAAVRIPSPFPKPSQFGRCELISPFPGALRCRNPRCREQSAMMTSACARPHHCSAIPCPP